MNAPRWAWSTRGSERAISSSIETSTWGRAAWERLTSFIATTILMSSDSSTILTLFGLGGLDRRLGGLRLTPTTMSMSEISRGRTGFNAKTRNNIMNMVRHVFWQPKFLQYPSKNSCFGFFISHFTSLYMVTSLKNSWKHSTDAFPFARSKRTFHNALFTRWNSGSFWIAFEANIWP